VLTRGGICVPPTVTYILAVPRFRLNTYGRRAFSVAGPMAWNSLPDFTRDPASSTDCLRVTSASNALGVLNDYALYKSTHSHLLTNLQGAKVWRPWRMLTRKCTVCLHTSATQQNHTLSVRCSLSVQLRSINAVASPGLAGRGTQNYVEMT